MQRRALSWGLGMLLGCAWIACQVTESGAKNTDARQRISVSDPVVDLVGGLEKAAATPRTSAVDTAWIADWSFDSGASCDDSGWQKLDLRDLAAITPTELFWGVDDVYDATGPISGNAATLGYQDNDCCESSAGYDNLWYQAIRIEYTGAATLSFGYLLDSELDYDFLRVEEDSACSSFERVDPVAAPTTFASDLRQLRYQDSGLNPAGIVPGLPLADYGPGTHCVYIAFLSDLLFSPCDGEIPTTIGAAAVLDNIVITDDAGVRSENFSTGALDIGSFVNIQDQSPFGQWGRLFPEITDNDVCTENPTCAWLWTDYSTPTIANDPSMGFAPGGFVVKNWLDNAILSPWVSLADTPNASGTVLQLRRFPGNVFSQSLIAANYSVRGRETVGASQCPSDWGHTLEWNSLDVFTWLTFTWDLSPDFEATSEEIQVRHRITDWQWLVPGTGPPSIFVPGPGPFVDRIRIGRIVLSGPVLNEGIDARYQAQDCFATEIHPGITPGTGEHFRPLSDRLGSAAFSQGTELGINQRSPNLITGDSVTVEVQDVRGLGGIASVEWYGAIVSGPHVGKAPPPHTVGPSGFFVVTADSARTSSGAIVADRYYVDLDDDYFRGGDVLHYFWLAEDQGGGVASLPTGLNAAPSSVEEAQLATVGMFEVSFLPASDWDAGYLARIQADPHGKLEPTSAERAGTSQSNCILYVNRINSRRRSGTINRTTFMHTLDRIGYSGAYDVYDHMGMGNTNNHLGGRCAPQQAQGYSLIVYDTGNATPSGTIMPDGSDIDSQKIDQAGWFRNWLGQATVSEAGTGTLWIIGSNVLEEKRTNQLFTGDMQVQLVTGAQPIEPNPDVKGGATVNLQLGEAVCPVDFVDDGYSLSGGCPFPRAYDGMASGGAAVETHHYQSPKSGALGHAAVVINTNTVGRWNTILQSHAWFDIMPLFPNPPSRPHPTQTLLQKVLNCVLATGCDAGEPTAVPDESVVSAAPQRTILHANAPNPFNPVTEIRFDLAEEGHVLLRVYDVTGRLVRTLIDGRRTVGADQRVLWDGLDAVGRRAPSGIYLYRLSTVNVEATRKMILMQ
jgi:hypothetical protein